MKRQYSLPPLPEKKLRFLLGPDGHPNFWGTLIPIIFILGAVIANMAFPTLEKHALYSCINSSCTELVSKYEAFAFLSEDESGNHWALTLDGAIIKKTKNSDWELQKLHLINTISKKSQLPKSFTIEDRYGKNYTIFSYQRGIEFYRSKENIRKQYPKRVPPSSKWKGGRHIKHTDEILDASQITKLLGPAISGGIDWQLTSAGDKINRHSRWLTSEFPAGVHWIFNPNGVATDDGNSISLVEIDSNRNLQNSKIQSVLFSNKHFYVVNRSDLYQINPITREIKKVPLPEDKEKARDIHIWSQEKISESRNLLVSIDDTIYVVDENLVFSKLAAFPKQRIEFARTGIKTGKVFIATSFPLIPSVPNFPTDIIPFLVLILVALTVSMLLITQALPRYNKWQKEVVKILNLSGPVKSESISPTFYTTLAQTLVILGIGYALIKQEYIVLNELLFLLVLLMFLLLSRVIIQLTSGRSISEVLTPADPRLLLSQGKFEEAEKVARLQLLTKHPRDPLASLCIWASASYLVSKDERARAIYEKLSEGNKLSHLTNLNILLLRLALLEPPTNSIPGLDDRTLKGLNTKTKYPILRALVKPYGVAGIELICGYAEIGKGRREVGIERLKEAIEIAPDSFGGVVAGQFLDIMENLENC